MWQKTYTTVFFTSKSQFNFIPVLTLITWPLKLLCIQYLFDLFIVGFVCGSSLFLFCVQVGSSALPPRPPDQLLGVPVPSF